MLKLGLISSILSGILVLGPSLSPSQAQNVIKVGIGHAHPQVAAGLRHYVAQQLSVDLSAVEVARVMPMNAQKKMRAGEIIAIRSAARDRVLGRPAFSITMQDPKGGAFEQWVSADVTLIRKVVVSRRKLKRSHILEADDLELLPLRLRRQNRSLQTDLHAVIGKRLKQSIREGAPLRREVLEEAPLIQRGDRVSITLSTGGIRIRTTGEAKQDGKRGENIKVMNLDSRKLVLAKVVNPGAVEIALQGGE